MPTKICGFPALNGCCGDGRDTGGAELTKFIPIVISNLCVSPSDTGGGTKCTDNYAISGRRWGIDSNKNSEYFDRYIEMSQIDDRN